MTSVRFVANQLPDPLTRRSALVPRIAIHRHEENSRGHDDDESETGNGAILLQ